jgi:hypothetical protein
MMSYIRAGRLSDDDIKAVIAYIRSIPAAGNPTPDPPDHMNMLGLVMLGAGMLPTGKPIITGHVSAPLKGPTREFGEYTCMRRSGITSRSKCAIFSISQTSCSSAGPRGPAVMML